MLTEKEKARLGMLYDANHDPEVCADRDRCYDLCFVYNQLRPSMIQARRKLMKQIVYRIGKNFLIEQPFWCDLGYNVEIGDDFYMNRNCSLVDGAKIIFGNHVFVAPYCGFYASGHPLDVEQRNAGLEYAKPITVGDNVWIGGHVVVLPGVTIGSNTTIGAGSVVTKDIPDGVLAFGNPCRVIRKL